MEKAIYCNVSSRAEFISVAAGSKITLIVYGGDTENVDDEVEMVRRYIRGLKIKLNADVLFRRASSSLGQERYDPQETILDIKGGTSIEDEIESAWGEIGQSE